MTRNNDIDPTAYFTLSRAIAGVAFTLKSAISGLAILALCLPARASELEFKGGAFEPPRMAPGFSLEGSDGKSLTLARYRGKVVLLGFGFTFCTDVCPTTLAVLSSVMQRLGNNATEVQVIYITVDPERDSPERLRQYLSSFNPAFVGGTGTAEQLQQVRNNFGILIDKNKKKTANGGYTVGHSSFISVIDRDGRLRVLMPYGRDANAYLHDIRILLQP